MKDKVGIFDSGVGGLTILKELYRIYPNVSYIYIGDNKNCPYGDKTKEELFMYASRIIDYFINNDINTIIIGCNTICSNILEELKIKYKNITLIGVIDATVKEFINTKYNEVLVIGTNGTIKSNMYQKKINELNSNIKVYSLSTPKLVPLIENNESVKEVLDEYLTPYKNISSIILGCTHYKLIEEYIDDMYIVNSSDGVVKEIKEYIDNNSQGSIKIYTTGNKILFNKLCKKIMNVMGEYLDL